MCKNHVIGDVSEKHYDRYDYLPEKRGRARSLGDASASGDRRANVIAIRA